MSNEIRLDGHSYVRLADVRSVDNRGQSDFVPRALRRSGEWPPSATPSIRLGSVRDLIADASAVSDLVTIHTELQDPERCFIGVPSKYGRTKLHLREISSQAAWDRHRKYNFEDITRVDIGGRYEGLLSALAGPQPPPPGQIK